MKEEVRWKYQELEMMSMAEYCSLGLNPRWKGRDRASESQSEADLGKVTPARLCFSCKAVSQASANGLSEVQTEVTLHSLCKGALKNEALKNEAFKKEVLKKEALKKGAFKKEGLSKKRPSKRGALKKEALKERGSQKRGPPKGPSPSVRHLQWWVQLSLHFTLVSLT